MHHAANLGDAAPGGNGEPGTVALPNPACHPGQVRLIWLHVSNGKQSYVVVEGHCAGEARCPLSQVKPGARVCIKELSASPEITGRLREMGLGEEQCIKLLSRQANYICQVCNARLGISERLAESIIVEPLPAARPGD